MDEKSINAIWTRIARHEARADLLHVMVVLLFGAFEHQKQQQLLKDLPVTLAGLRGKLAHAATGSLTSAAFLDELETRGNQLEATLLRVSAGERVYH